MVTFDAVTIVVCFRLVKVCWFSEFEVGYLFITFGYLVFWAVNLCFYELEGSEQDKAY